MAGAKVGTNKSVSSIRVRKLDGKVVKPVVYNGRAVGHGAFLAGEVEGKLVVDDKGVPLKFRTIGALE